MTGVDITPQAARDELYEIIRKEAPFEQRAREALELGRQYLDADSGYLTRIDQATNHWEVIATTDDADGMVPPDLEADLDGTYCRRTIESNTQIALNDAPNQGWEDDIAFETYGLHCYHGTAVIIDGEPYGTVCFGATDPRGEFTEGETMFAELIARLLERELENEQHEFQLTRQTNLAIVLNRVLRHNLRNDMSVVRGYTQIMAEKLESPRFGDVALRNIDQLLDIVEKARQLDRVIAADLDLEPTDITALVETIVETTSETYPNATISVEAPTDESIVAPVLDSFEQALTELIENAAKHCGEAPTVTVSVDLVPNAVEIRIADDGPGLSEQETAVLESGTETTLAHGSGLGLWLTHWIITSHDGTLEATVTDDGTTMMVSLPRTQLADVDQQLTKLRREHDQYQAAFHDANDAMVILNDDGYIVDANPEASSIYGLDHQSLLGQPFEQFLPEDFNFEEAWTAFKNAGRERGTVTLIGADGVERKVEYSGTVDVVPGQHLVVSRDISDRIEREQALEETTHQLKAVIEACPDAIMAVDADGTVQLWNDAAEDLFGYSSDAVVGESIRSLEIHSDAQREAFEQTFKRALAGEMITNHELRRQTKDGDSVHLRISTVPIRDDSGEITGVMGIAKRDTKAAQVESD